MSHSWLETRVVMNRDESGRPSVAITMLNGSPSDNVAGNDVSHGYSGSKFRRLVWPIMAANT